VRPRQDHFAEQSPQARKTCHASPHVTPAYLRARGADNEDDPSASERAFLEGEDIRLEEDEDSDLPLS
jgi:hypothetical protein